MALSYHLIPRSDADVKTDVEELSPTRVRLSVEVPFEELKPSLDKAYREIAQQVRIKGFRPGRVPPPVIDRNVGREYVLSQAVNEAIPGFYDKAVTEAGIQALGTPEVDVTKLDYGQQITFTVEVDIRPDFELPDLTTLSVEVDGTLVTPDEVEEYLASLQERFASLKAVQRPVENNDFVSIDLSASVDGTPVEDAQASGLSYQVGSGSLLEGLDEALTGMAAGDTATFRTELAGGDFAGREADVTVTVHSVKTKEMPGLDDDFAQLASEFDTLGEFRSATRTQLEQMKSVQQVMQAREKSLEALLAAVDIPLPAGIIQAEIDQNKESIQEQLKQAGMDLPSYLAANGEAPEKFESDLAARARRAVKVSLILDKLARQESIGVDPQELSGYIAQQAEQMGVVPDRLAQQLVQNGQIQFAAGEVLRAKAINVIAERARVTDASGAVVDVAAALHANDPESLEAAADEDAADEDADVVDAEVDVDAEDDDETDDSEA
jgi:trigger factor